MPNLLCIDKQKRVVVAYMNRRNLILKIKFDLGSLFDKGENILRKIYYFELK